MASFEGNGEKEKAPLAQMVEHSAHNRIVVGSSPTRRDIMNIFDYYEYNNIIKDVAKNDNLEDCLKLLDIIYFEGSLQEGNENRYIYEFSQTRTIAIEVLFKEQKIRFWGWIGKRDTGDYFWKYLHEVHADLLDKIIELLLEKYFLLSEEITFEIVGNCETDTIGSWLKKIK